MLAGILALVFTAPAEGIDLSGKGSNFSLNLDITLSCGARYRVEERDPAIISPFEGGTAWSVNGDDGNLNFDKGSSSATPPRPRSISVLHTIRTSKYSFGFFVRGSAFYDFALEKDCCERTELTEEALDWAGSRTELLDAYAWLAVSGVGEIRVGRQVLNWGESTFIQGGLSVINPVDVSALRVPGSELREAFRPVGMVWASFDLSQNLSVEGFYQYEWEPIVIDPPGTYFSTNDFAGPGGENVFLAFGSFPDTGESPVLRATGATVDYPFMSVPRGDTGRGRGRRPVRSRAALFVPELGRHRVRLLLPELPQPAADHQRHHRHHRRAPWPRRPRRSRRRCAIYCRLRCAAGREPGGRRGGRAGRARRQRTSIYAQTASWYTAYPEDIKLYGLSWNAQLGTSGIAFQGEVSYRQDAPYQVDDVELLFAALSPISAGLAGDQPGRARRRSVSTRRSTATAARLVAAPVHPHQDLLQHPRRRPGRDPRRVRLQQGLRHAVQGRAAFRGPGHLHQRQPAHVAARGRPRGQTVRSSRSTSPTTSRGATGWSAA